MYHCWSTSGRWDRLQHWPCQAPEGDLAPDRHGSSRRLHMPFVPRDEPSSCDGSERNWHWASNPSPKPGCSLTQCPLRKITHLLINWGFQAGHLCETLKADQTCLADRWICPSEQLEQRCLWNLAKIPQQRTCFRLRWILQGQQPKSCSVPSPCHCQCHQNKERNRWHSFSSTSANFLCKSYFTDTPLTCS